MAKHRLTEAFIRKLKAPDPSGHAQIYRDADLRGFGVLVSGRSDHKSYVVTYGAKFQRRTIGSVDLFPLDEARTLAVEMLKQMKRGVDPNTASKPTSTKSNAITLRQLLAKRVTDEKHPLRPASVKCYTNVSNKHLSDFLDRPLAEITPDAVHDLHRHLQIGQ